MPRNNLRSTAKAGAMNVSKKDRRSAIGRLVKMVLKDYPWQFAFVLLCIVLNSGAGAVGSYIVGTVIVDDYITPALRAGATSLPPEFTIMIAVMAGVYALGLVGGYFYNYFMAKIAQGVMKKIRDDLFNHMLALPISYFDSRTHGDIMSIYTNDVDALREFLSRALPMIASAVATMVICLVMMLITDFLLTAVVILFAAAMFLLTRVIAKRSSKYFISQQIELGKTNGYIEEMVTGQKVVKVFNYEERNILHFREHNDDLYAYSVKANRYASILMPAVNQLGNLQYAIIALLGGLAIVMGAQNGFQSLSLTGFHAIEVGNIISFLMFSKSFVQPIGQVSQQLNIAALALAGATRIFAMGDEPSETDEGYVELCYAREDENGNPVETSERTGKWAWKHPHKDGSPTSYTWLQGKIDMYNVDFAYGNGKTVLHDITLYAKPGQKIAFVGPTGAGKTTITNLLTRFYDIADGKVRYDDININKIKKSDLRRSLGMVLQDTKLFTGTVRENIRFGRLEATDEEVERAAKLANADSFIRNLPNGYDTVLINGGASLSQGQRQLLSIARCAVSDPPVMILDEATSSIDSRTEALVQDGMDAIMKGRTVFVIAHRLSTIQNSDVIMVLDQGRIIERGNHDDLIAKKGKYYQLYTGHRAANA